MNHKNTKIVFSPIVFLVFQKQIHLRGFLKVMYLLRKKGRMAVMSVAATLPSMGPKPMTSTNSNNANELVAKQMICTR